MNRSHSQARGRPIVFLVTLAAIWIAVRFITWQAPVEAELPPQNRIAGVEDTSHPAGQAPTVQPDAADNASTSAEDIRQSVATSATMVEGLDPVPLPQIQPAYVEEPVALGHEMLWMAASQTPEVPSAARSAE